MRNIQQSLVSVTLLTGASLTLLLLGSAIANGQQPTPQQVFEARIMPIFKSPNPSSCVQCHLSGVDLKNYILPSHEKTFVSLRDQGLINLDKPEESKILKLIQMGAKDDNQGAALIQQKVRQLEYDAFAEWLKASAADPKLRNAPKLSAKELALPARPLEVIRHARKDHLLESFEKNIWALRFRCMSCHIEGTPENNKLRKEFGERVTWIKKEGALATMNYLLASKLIDTKSPEKSLLLTKPLNEVKHEGGKKILVGDQGYKAFRGWLEDYARIVNDQYATAAALPKEDKTQRFGSEIWLKISNTQPAWADRLLTATVYAWDAEKKAWESTPCATTDRGVFGKGRLWQHNLTLLAAQGSERARTWQRGKPALPAGRYLVRVYVDGQGRLAKDWKAELGAADYAGAAEITANWPEGYGNMTAVDGARFRR